MKKKTVFFDDQLDSVATQQEDDESVLTTGLERNGMLILDIDSRNDEIPLSQLKPYKRMESYVEKEDDDEEEYSEESEGSAPEPDDGRKVVLKKVIRREKQQTVLRMNLNKLSCNSSVKVRKECNLKGT